MIVDKTEMACSAYVGGKFNIESGLVSSEYFYAFFWFYKIHDVFMFDIPTVLFIGGHQRG